jgi:hypothetical protein
MANASKGRNVFGKGRLKNRGMVIKGIRINNGYNDIGRTNVLPPRSVGKNGKLVTGKVKNNNPQITRINRG